MWILLLPVLLLALVILIGIIALGRWLQTRSRHALYTWVVCAVVVALMLMIGYMY
ncbi:hypothetical protein KDJ56_17455 [Brevibacillus composti]|uniref:Uncharacterized protein n=1 Tax=Brevibacillus composti TaxID=2796470 RepID=A0A7T5JN05_9BACL|nr:hypothetical protein [Brevibacillus composti]QQE73664.1 hypothetical protein JD108_17510 [Brevibacillus composti]QUO40747.1 hypothetical protein KDJ56_17455 [Brevibacillus composti]